MVDLTVPERVEVRPEVDRNFPGDLIPKERILGHRGTRRSLLVSSRPHSPSHLTRRTYRHRKRPGGRTTPTRLERRRRRLEHERRRLGIQLGLSLLLRTLARRRTERRARHPQPRNIRLGRLGDRQSGSGHARHGWFSECRDLGDVHGDLFAQRLGDGSGGLGAFESGGRVRGGSGGLGVGELAGLLGFGRLEGGLGVGFDGLLLLFVLGQDGEDVFRDREWDLTDQLLLPAVG